MNYNKLFTRDFMNLNHNQNITEKELIDLLKHAYLNTRFSTFPYIYKNMNSEESIKNYNEGNCIALSIYLKDILMKKGIKSYLIPATIPYFIQHPDLLEISHVALAVPKNKDNTFILDCAFYFINPLKIYHKNGNNKILKLMNFTNNNLDYIDSYNEVINENRVYNKYQSIPRGTRLCNCVDRNNTKSKWSYILREIINPDEAITSFFIKVRNNPFFLTTGYKNGRCTKDIEVNMYNNNKVIVINKNNRNIYNGEIDKASVRRIRNN